jgi:inner membrane protein
VASPITHAVVAVSLATAWNRPKSDWRFLAVGVLCAEIPDIDVLTFWFGVPYGSLWGHRGLTHSLLFAAAFAAVMACVTSDSKEMGRERFSRWSYFFLATASHGLGDAVTDGGLGVALFAPFDTTRYFFPFRPVVVSPLHWNVFFSTIGLRVLLSEALWIWLPCLLFAVVSIGIRRIPHSARRNPE